MTLFSPTFVAGAARPAAVALALSLLLFTAGLLGAGWLKFVFQEPVEADFMVADITMAPGTPAYVTARAVDRLEQAVAAVGDEVAAEHPGRPPVFRHYLASVGDQPMMTRRSQMSASLIIAAHPSVAAATVPI